MNLADAIVERVHIATKPEMFGMAASFQGSTLAMIASLTVCPTAEPSMLKTALISVKLNTQEEMVAYRRNMKPFVAVAMSFVGIAA